MYTSWYSATSSRYCNCVSARICSDICTLASSEQHIVKLRKLGDISKKQLGLAYVVAAIEELELKDWL